MDLWLDSAGLLTSVDGPLPGAGDTIGFTYDSAGNLATQTDQVGHVTSGLSHDGQGAPLTLQDENGIQTTVAYDGVGRPTAITVDPGPAGSQ